MALMQFISLVWKNLEPSFLLYDGKKERLEHHPLNNTLYISRGTKRQCRGYYNLNQRSFMPCPSYPTPVDSKYTQCRKCEELSGFSLCLGCNGNACRTHSHRAKSFCNQEHFVYLAYFEKSLIKVGTAVEYRKFERLLEQGALYSIFIAKTPDGRIARRIEDEVTRHGIVSRVSLSKKAKNIIITDDAAAIKTLLIDTYNNLLSSLPRDLAAYFIKPTPIICDYLYLSDKIREHFVDHNYQRSLFDIPNEIHYKTPDVIMEPLIIEGEVLTVIGNLLVVRMNDSVSVVATQSLCGWEVII